MLESLVLFEKAVEPLEVGPSWSTSNGGVDVMSYSQALVLVSDSALCCLVH